MKVLVIPDVHLKPYMFEQAKSILVQGLAECAVCLMDIPDDWNQQYNIDKYELTFDAAIRFAEEFPDTLWCYGNHDLSYVWNQRESGFSYMAAYLVRQKIDELREKLPDEHQLQYIHRIDNVIFCHGGLFDSFVKDNLAPEICEDTDAVIASVNAMGEFDMWDGLSPIWARPQYVNARMYKPDQLLQVVGHTPVEKIIRTQNESQNLISCDVFSTYRDGRCIGTQQFVILDTQTWEYQAMQGEPAQRDAASGCFDVCTT